MRSCPGLALSRLFPLRTLALSVAGLAFAACSDSSDPPGIASIALSPGADTIGVGKTLSLSAVVTDVNGATVVGRPIDWTSSADAVASVNSDGLVTAKTIGTATISAAVGGKTDDVFVEVVDVCSTLLSTPIAVGQSLPGVLETNDCLLDDGTVVDGFRVTVAATTDVQIDLTSTVFDTYLFLLEETDTDLVQVAEDDDGSGGTDARLVFTMEAGKIYHVLANNLDPAEPLGAYTLSLSAAPTPLVEQAPQASLRAKTVVKRRFAELWRR